MIKSVELVKQVNNQGAIGSDIREGIDFSSQIQGGKKGC